MAPSWLIAIEAVLHLLALSADRCLGLHIHGPHSRPRSSKPPADENAFLILPSQVNLEGVSKQYPLTVHRRLFSSVPYRDYAVCNASLGLSSQYVVLITGASSSGKSCLLKMIAGLESPTTGSIRIEAIPVDDSTTTGAVAPIAKPVYLDQREFSNSFRSVGEIVTQREKKWRPPDMPELLGQRVVQELRQRLGLGALRVWESKCCDLTQTEAYCLGLLLASIESMFAANSTRCSTGEDDGSYLLPAPILLLDEWMDMETSGVIQSVQNRLGELLEMGAVVCSVTHKADRWTLHSKVRQIKFRSGKIVDVLYFTK